MPPLRFGPFKRQEFLDARHAARELGLVTGSDNQVAVQLLSHVSRVLVDLRLFRRGHIRDFDKRLVAPSKKTVDECLTVEGWLPENHERHKARILDLMAAGPDKWEPIIVAYKDKGPAAKQGTWRLDGQHRVIAAHLLGLKRIPAFMIKL
jgi:hypothetical protein